MTYPSYCIIKVDISIRTMYFMSVLNVDKIIGVGRAMKEKLSAFDNHNSPNQDTSRTKSSINSIPPNDDKKYCQH